VFIESSGIVIQPQVMVAGSGALSTLDDEGSAVQTSEEATAPLFVLAPRIIERHVSKSDGSYWPAQQSQIRLTFIPTVDVEPILGGAVSIVISGLHGVVLDDEEVAIGGASAYKFTSCDTLDMAECESETAKWDQSRSVLTLNVLKKLKMFEIINVTLDFENAIDGQDAPDVFIALHNNNGRDSQGLRMSTDSYDAAISAATNSSALAALFSGYNVNSTVMVWNLPLSAEEVYEARDDNTSTDYMLFEFEGMVDLQESVELEFAVQCSGPCELMVDGQVVVFSDTLLDNFTLAAGGATVGEPVALMAGMLSFRARLQQITGVLGFAAYSRPAGAGDGEWEPISAEAFFIRVDLFELPPRLMHNDEDARALYIMPSASFTTKNISQSTSAPGATNTITIVVRPQFNLTGDEMSTITVSGLLGSATPDKSMKLLDANPTFNATARWTARTGTLVLLVAPGQVVSSESDTQIMFDLTNPQYPQDGPQLVQISAMGDVPISAAAMDLGAGDAAPLKVVSSSFTQLGVNSSTTAPGATNTITVTFQADVVLSSSRRSGITVQGLVGSATRSTRALPITMIEGDDTAFVSPIPDITISFSPECSLSDNKALLMVPGTDDLKDVILFFTAEACEDRWTRVVDYDSQTKCATIEVIAGDWSDGEAACTALGAVDSIQVVDGGHGYRSGAVLISDEVSGSGLNATCVVDDRGSIVEVLISEDMHGSGFGMGLPQAGRGGQLPGGVQCPSACDEYTCGVKEASGQGGRLTVRLAPATVALSAALFNGRTGAVELRVRDRILPSARSVFSFELENGLVPQDPRDVYVMASGRSPIPSTRVEGKLMGIAGLATTVTAVCTAACPDDGECQCTKSLTGFPADKPVYALKAELQCNGMASNVTVTVDDAEVDVEQPECTDSCSTYSTLFAYVNVAEHATDGTLDLKAKAQDIGTDFCGAGHNLKVVFTLMY
jgi:hypothetical protein